MAPMGDPNILPVKTVLPELLAQLERQKNAVLVAPPGAGKSTVVPLALLDASWALGQKILLLEPRRLAARAVSRRMADTLREPVGATVGYRMRMDTRVGPKTRLEVVTEGVLTRMLQDDPALTGIAAVIFDEFHERSLHADLGLALCREAQDSLGLSLRILVMSATLDGAAVAACLNDAPIVRAEGRQFPVTTHYLGQSLPKLPDYLTVATHDLERIANQIQAVLQQTEGDALVFLPGASEILRLQRILESHSTRDSVIHALYGELHLDAQQAVMNPAPKGVRKIILSTNVAETSLTIDGVCVVIDLGLARRSLFDPVTGMERLVTVRIARSSAEQRAGRAGRTAPGTAWRLWGEGAQQTLPAQTPAEILTADLTSLALELAQWGTRDVSELAWLDAPPAASLAQARELLQRLEALDGNFKITSVGEAMLATGLHPRLAHMLVRAQNTPLHSLAATVAALLTERDILRQTRDPDMRTRLEALRGHASGSNPGAIQRLRELARRLGGNEVPKSDLDDQVGVVLCWAYPDRIAQVRQKIAGKTGSRYLLANGRGAALETISTLSNSEYLVAIDLDDAEGAEAQIRLAAPLTRPQLETAMAAQISESVESESQTRSGALQMRKVRRLQALILDEQRIVPDAQQRQDALLAHIRRVGVDSLPWGDAGLALRARLALLSTHGVAKPGVWPTFDNESLLIELDEWLAPWLANASNANALTADVLGQALRARLNHAQRQTLEEQAPTHVAMPTGTRVAVDYLDENAPCVEVRMQEVFGLAQTPRLAGGKVALTMKLLSPARRPMQITRDLAGFWQGSYAEVRKEMRGRYPRHYWPENPLEAEPVRGLRPKKPR
jgi:ATP-dependent helicase HrpB